MTASSPPTKGTSVIRLWHRIGVFRLLSVVLLVMGVAAAGYLSVDRQSQQRVNPAADTKVAVSIEDQQRQLQVAMAERDRASAASRNAQREAQAKADAAAAEAAASAKAADEATRKKQTASPSASASPSKSTPAKTPDVGQIPASCNSYTGNKAIGCTLMLQSGFGLDQMGCLDKLWMKESGWRVNASNGSGAYGIPQALPKQKMAAYGADYQTNPVPQIKWGLSYIKGKYRTPCGAWSNWQAKGWY